jgi:heme-degrading monooxygenase HmoA
LLLQCAGSRGPQRGRELVCGSHGQRRRGVTELELTTAKEALLICRIWHGWTTTENSRRYEEIVRGEVIPAIDARRIPGFLSIDLVRRAVSDGFEFATITWFADIESVKTFVSEDYEVAHVPERARKVLSHFDARSTHYEVLDRREHRTST